MLQDYGVDKVFVLENGNTDSSQRNIVYLVHGESVTLVQAAAGMTPAAQHPTPSPVWSASITRGLAGRLHGPPFYCAMVDLSP